MTDVRWVALSLTGRIGSKTLQSLLNYFEGDIAAVLAADSKTLQRVQGVGPKIAGSIKAINLNQVADGITRWQRAGIRIITLQDDTYPSRLRALPDAPPTLFARGHVSAMTKSIAIVGTRQPTDAARGFAQNLSTALVQRGYTIISGLAFGIDSAAHLGALAHPQGRTGAVLGCGILNIYPAAHQRLAEQITVDGFIISEIGPDLSTSPASLVARNRIITGLSDALIVVETAVDGGAMHAARFAAQQGLPVYTLESKASGNQALIASGAAVLSSEFTRLPF